MDGEILTLLAFSDLFLTIVQISASKTEANFGLCV